MTLNLRIWWCRPGEGLWLWLAVGEGRGFLACGTSQQDQLKLVALAQHRKAKGEQSCQPGRPPGFVSLGFSGLSILNCGELRAGAGAGAWPRLLLWAVRAAPPGF